MRGIHWLTGCEVNDRFERVMQREAAICVSRNVELWTNTNRSESRKTGTCKFFFVHFDFIRFERFEFIYTHLYTQHSTVIHMHTGIGDRYRKMQRYTICKYTHKRVLLKLYQISSHDVLSSTLCFCRHMHAITVLTRRVYEKEEKQRQNSTTTS